MVMNAVVLVILVLALMKMGMEWWLTGLNEGEVRKHEGKVPEGMEAMVTEEVYERSRAYTLAKLGFEKLENLYEGGILLAVVMSGFMGKVYGVMTEYFGRAVWGQAMVMSVFLLIIGLPGLPVDWWRQFKLEEAFGFNRMNMGLWVSDRVKSMVIGFVIGLPFMAGLIWFYGEFEGTWWVWGWVGMIGLQLVMMVIYPKVILPLFNKLRPLEEGKLKVRLMAMAERGGFKASTIEVIDGSRRSGHSNAFFTGFGRFRRIVLFDTLIEQLSEEELEAVLAHEIGHYRKGHVVKHLVASGVGLGLFLIGLDWMTKQEWFYGGMGFQEGEGVVPMVMVMVMCVGLVTFWVRPVMNGIFRKHEYEADEFAAGVMGGSEALVSSLKKLHVENLSNLTPHRLYSKFYYTHPTLVERVRALKGEGR